MSAEWVAITVGFLITTVVFGIGYLFDVNPLILGLISSGLSTGLGLIIIHRLDRRKPH